MVREVHGRYSLREFLSGSVGSRKDREVLNNNLATLATQYGIAVDLRGQTTRDRKAGVFDIRALNIFESGVATGILLEELGKYPPEYVHSLKIRTFRLVNQMRDRKGGRSALGGLATQRGQRLYASTENGNYDSYRKTIHHEMMHRSDESECETETRGGVVYSVEDEQNLLESWEALNAGGGRYLKSAYYTEQARHDFTDFSIVPGFARFYGRRNVFEDRATLAEELMTDTGKIFDRAANDEILRRKIRGLIDIFERRSSGIMGEKFFLNLAGRTQLFYEPASN